MSARHAVVVHDLGAPEPPLTVCAFSDVPHPQFETCEGTQVVACAWWALCPNAATKTRPHPILGAVPICALCDAKVEALS